MEFNPIHSILEEDEDDEEPPRILLYHGKSREAARGACASACGEPWAEAASAKGLSPLHFPSAEQTTSEVLCFLSFV